jgi:zinc transport system ATP-binding protein
MANKVIRFHDVDFGYTQNEPILKNVNIDIEQGMFLGVIGPNGGGKTTLLKLILGLLKPWKGEISVFDKKPPIAQGIAYVPQAMSIDKKFPITVQDVVLGGRIKHLSPLGRFSDIDFQKMKEALHFVGLYDLKNKDFGSLSNGQAQRVLIARALSSESSLLLFDEPTSSVDVAGENAFLEIMEKLKGTLTILMVTHNLRGILKDVHSVILVQGKAVMMQPKEICEHFALGLYHIPLTQIPDDHFIHHEGT